MLDQTQEKRKLKPLIGRINYFSKFFSESSTKHLVALSAYQRRFVMQIDANELSLAKTLVESLTTERFDPG